MVRKIVDSNNTPIQKEESFVPATIVSRSSVPADLDADAKNKLSPYEYEIFAEHIKKGGFPLSVPTAMSFFELYLNGYDVPEIHRLNSAFPVGAIYWAKVVHDWEGRKNQILTEMAASIKEKVLKAQLETTGLMADLLIMTNKKQRDKIKKYLQTGNEKDLQGIVGIDSVQGLIKLAEGLNKFIGQDNTKKIKEEKNININLNSSNNSDTVSNDTPGELTPDEAALILSTLAASKRRKEGIK